MRLCGMRVVMVLGLVALGGCGLFSSDSEEPKSLFAADAPAPETPPVPIQNVSTIELGRTRDGFIVTAYGTAPGLGYGRPSLAPRRDGAVGTDGFLDYDFVAVPPAPGFNLPQGDAAARALRADLVVKLRTLRGAAGIRVHGLDGGAQMTF